MFSRIRTYIFCVSLFLFTGLLWGQNKEHISYNIVAENFIKRHLAGFTFQGIPTVIETNGMTAAYLYQLLPQGFVVIVKDTLLYPVYAYSCENGIDINDLKWYEWENIICADISSRSVSAAFLTSNEKGNISAEWNSLLSGTVNKKLFQQWPPAGSTTTGGWIETNWTQSAPYNNLCPMDLNAGSRSIAGCPAVAMAQILNFHKEINGTSLNDSDDYYHNYGAGNQYWIDNDSATHDFPGFGTLNLYLDSLENFYSLQAEPPNKLKASVVFACGVAATQVYSSSGSGTFGIDQAANAYQRFGFTNSRLVYPADTNLNADLAGNMKTAHPAHLGVVNAGVTAGHNVVVDGYNTDDFYHFNFGWGGSYNGWYTMPPTSMPYSLNYIEGVVLDINVDSSASNIAKDDVGHAIKIYPNPATDLIHIEFEKNIPQVMISLFDVYGRQILRKEFENDAFATLNLIGFAPGMYLLHLESHGITTFTLKIIKK